MEPGAPQHGGRVGPGPARPGQHGPGRGPGQPGQLRRVDGTVRVRAQVLGDAADQAGGQCRGAGRPAAGDLVEHGVRERLQEPGRQQPERLVQRDGPVQQHRVAEHSVPHVHHGGGSAARVFLGQRGDPGQPHPVGRDAVHLPREADRSLALHRCTG
ncbi:hypothetical protein XF36_00335 [Pseudonocardia sp. HH130629-09]|nr:hypothetical protein XF36_00335 [Pseudonocardia sp. HH130629-09]